MLLISREKKLNSSQSKSPTNLKKSAEISKPILLNKNENIINKKDKNILSSSTDDGMYFIFLKKY